MACAMSAGVKFSLATGQGKSSASVPCSMACYMPLVLAHFLRNI